MISIIANWDEVLEDTRKTYSISDTSFNLWIKPLMPLEIFEGTIIVQAPDEMLVDYINKVYSPMLEKSAFEVLHLQCKIRAIFDENSVAITLKDLKDYKERICTEIASNEELYQHFKKKGKFNKRKLLFQKFCNAMKLGDGYEKL